MFLIHPNPLIYVLTLFYFEEIPDTKILFDIWLHKLALSMNQKTFAKCKTFMSSFRQIQDFCRWYMVQWRGKDSALLLFLSVDCQNNHNHFFCPRSLDWSTFYQFKTCKKYKSVKINIFIQTASWYNDFWSYFVTENGFECNLGPFEEISVFLLV